MQPDAVRNILPFSDISPRWKMMVLPGGREPERKTKGSAGRDIYTRAIVSLDSDPDRPYMRKTLFDFDHVCDASVAANVTDVDGEKIYLLHPGKTVRIGIGIVMELPPNQAAYVEPRGSTANNLIEVASEPVCIGECDPILLLAVNMRVPSDSDFRSEPSSLLKNIGDRVFEIRRHQRIVQLVRKWIDISDPSDDPLIVEGIADLSETDRGFGQNASTGHR